MRRINSLFLTNFIAESGTDLAKKIYYGFIELDGYYCLAVAESLDSEEDGSSAKLCVDRVIGLFHEKPTMKSGILKQYVKAAHDELIQRSVKNHLKASILLLVSDYTRVRYAQCGNMMFYLLRDNSFVWKSGTHTVYQNMVARQELPADGMTGMKYASNLTSFLGSGHRLQITVSAKILLKEGDFLLLASPSFWTRISPVEILDADEERKEAKEFLGNLEDILLSSQELGVSSYCLAAVTIKKVYFEDQVNKKKWIKRIIIISILLVIVLSLLAAGILSIRKRNKQIQEEVQSRVSHYCSSGDLYLGAESYESALSQYEKALEELPKLKDEKLKLGQEQELLQKMSMLADLQKAEAAMQSGDFQLAKKLFIKTKDLLKQYPDLGLEQILSKNLAVASKQIDIINLKDYAKLQEGAQDYGGAVKTYDRLYEMQRILEDYDGMKETRLLLFDLEQIQDDKGQIQLSQKEESEAAAQAEENQQKVGAAKSKAQEAEQAVIDKNLTGAIAIYRGVREELLVLGANEEAEKIFNTILTLEGELKRQETEQKAIELEEAIKKIDSKRILAEQALLGGQVEEAKSIYKEMSNNYIELGEIEKASEIYQILLGL